MFVQKKKRRRRRREGGRFEKKTPMNGAKGRDFAQAFFFCVLKQPNAI